MSLYGTPSSAYWARPEPNREEVIEEATWQADQLVSEWADFAEIELFIDVRLDGGEPVWILRQVARDGAVLEEEDTEYEDLEQLRGYLTEQYPFIHQT